MDPYPIARSDVQLALLSIVHTSSLYDRDPVLEYYGGRR